MWANAKGGGFVYALGERPLDPTPHDASSPSKVLAPVLPSPARKNAGQIRGGGDGGGGDNTPIVVRVAKTAEPASPPGHFGVSSLDYGNGGSSSSGGGSSDSHRFPGVPHPGLPATPVVTSIGNTPQAERAGKVGWGVLLPSPQQQHALPSAAPMGGLPLLQQHLGMGYVPPAAPAQLWASAGPLFPPTSVSEALVGDAGGADGGAARRPPGLPAPPAPAPPALAPAPPGGMALQLLQQLQREQDDLYDF